MNAEIVATLEKEYPAPRRDVPLGVLLEAIGQVKRLSMKQSAGTTSPDDDLALLELYRKLADLAPDMALEEYERLFSIALEANGPDDHDS